MKRKFVAGILALITLAFVTDLVAGRNAIAGIHKLGWTQ
jgi:hypothetical protein